jgi:ketosteroid isomerase-like protein
VRTRGVRRALLVLLSVGLGATGLGAQEVLRDLISTSDTVTEAHNEDLTVHGFGTTAVVTGWLIVGGRGAEGPFQRRYRFTDTWARLEGRWRIVAAHDYLAPRK